jgi:hypothetical protein
MSAVACKFMQDCYPDQYLRPKQSPILAIIAAAKPSRLVAVKLVAVRSLDKRAAFYL